ncbi:MAG: transporter substrate-binding domain-containing protein [Desulfococcaceae bacterium]|nr:transporter substrate-binding domain-containing protein [Desulfococcaceae bacterium]
MGKKYFYLAAVIIFSLFLGKSVSADEIKVVTETWEPYNFEKDGKVTGISTEIVEYSLKKAGIGISGNKINIYPWVRAYRMAMEDENILIYTILRTQEREDLFKWVGPLIPSEKFYFYKNKSRTDISLHSLDDAKKYQIGVLRGSVHEDFLLRNGFPATLIQTVADQELNLKKLLAGRIDFIIDTDSSLGIRTKQMNLPLSEFEKTLFLFENGYYMAFSKKTSDDIIEKIRNAFFTLKKEGGVDKIIEKYK